MRIKLRNFLSFKNCDFDFNDFHGLVLVEGRNLCSQGADSNGAGKSALWDGLLWGLFDETARGLRYDDVICWGERQGGVEVEGADWHIKRYRDRSSSGASVLTFSRNGKVLETTSKAATQNLIESFLGTNFQNFTHSTVFGQNAESFADLRDSDRRSVLSGVCRLDRYDKAQERAVLKAERLGTQLNLVETEINATNLALNQLDISSLQSFSETWEAEQEKTIRNRMGVVVRAQTNLEEIKIINSRQLAELQSKVEELRKEYAGALVLKADLEGEKVKKKQVDKKLLTLSSSVGNAEAAIKRQELVENGIRSRKGSIGKLEEELQGLLQGFTFEGLVERIDELRSEIEKGQDEQGETGQALSKVQARLSTIQGEVATLRNNKGGKCPACLQAVSVEHVDSCVTMLEKEKASLTKEGLALRRKQGEQLDLVQSRRAEKKDLIQVRIACQEVRSELSNANTRLSELIEEKKSFLDLPDIDKLRKQYSDLTAEAVEVHGRIEGLEKQFFEKQELGRKLEGLEVEERALREYDYAPWLEVVENAQKEVELAKEAVNPYHDLITRAEAKKKEYEGMLSGLDLSAEAYRSELALAQFWTTAFKRLKLFVFDNLVPELTELTNYYLQKLSDGAMTAYYDTQTTLKSGASRDKFDLQVELDGQKLPFSAYSGGQKAKIRWACNLGLASLVESRSPHKSPFIILDEPLTGLDEQGRLKVFELLQSLLSKYRTIFVVDHNSEFKERFSEIITVEYRDGRSTIVNG